MENSEKNAEKVASPSEDAVSNAGSVEINNSQQSPDDKNEQEQTTAPEEAEATLNGVSESIENRINLQDLETTELKVKVICLEKSNIALKMELQCSELQLQAKTKVDAQKTRLIELLEAKVQSLQKKNTHLMEMFESLLKMKDTQSHRLISAAKSMEELSDRLTDSERMRNELRSMNQELKIMLGSIEDKGTQIAKVAKEKVLKYKAEALEAQQQLNNMKKSTSGIPEEAGAANDQPSERFQENWKKIDDLQQQMVAALQDQTLGRDAESVTNIDKDIKQELEQIRTGFNALLNGNQDENEKLLSSLDSIRLLVVVLKQLGQERASESSESNGNKDTSTSVDRDQEISQLQERLNQFNAGIAKLDDLFATVSNK